MPVTRYIATVKFPTVLDMKAVDGSPSDIAHVVACVSHTERATKAEIKEFAHRHVTSLKIAEGGEIVDVRPETAEHNIPNLEPEAWARFQNELAALDRRIRGA
jgi:hypothetical protein